MIDTNLEFRAVQESAASFCMDWPVFESWESREIRFDGTVFVLDSDGVKVSHSSWDSPSDESADDALVRIGEAWGPLTIASSRRAGAEPAPRQLH